MRDFAPPFGLKLTQLLFGVLEKAYSQDAQTDLDPKYAKPKDAVPRKDALD